MKKYLERQKEEGRLALQNYMYYYWGDNLHKLTFCVSDLLDEDAPV